MAAKLIADLVRDMWDITKKCSNPKEVEAMLTEKTTHLSIQKILDLEESIGVLRTLMTNNEKKKLIQCSYCDKKLISIKTHIQKNHTCDSCGDTTIRDMDSHLETCKEYIEDMTAYAEELGGIYIPSESWIFKIIDGNAYEFDSGLKTVGAYVGRLRADNTLDTDAKEVLKEKELIQCAYCDKKLLTLGSHIYHKHTCYRCNDATVRDLESHLKTCNVTYQEQVLEPPSIQKVELKEQSPGPVTEGGGSKKKKEKDNYAICQKYGLTILEGKGYKISDGNKVYEFDYDTCLPGECIGRVGPGGTIIRPKETSSVEGGGSKKKKEKIPSHIKTLVWIKYIGSSIPEAKCYCCKHERIEIRSFECGHVIAEAKGGELTLENLRPICKGCNSGMGTMSMDEYAKKFFGWSVLTGQQLVAVTEDPVSNKEEKQTQDLDIFSIPITPSKTPTVDPFADLLSF
jgi:predicted SprT family Zn-dependent metalloprotease